MHLAWFWYWMSSDTDPVFIEGTDWSVERKGHRSSWQQSSGWLHHIQCGSIGVQEGQCPTVMLVHCKLDYLLISWGQDIKTNSEFLNPAWNKIYGVYIRKHFTKSLQTPCCNKPCKTDNLLLNYLKYSEHSMIVGNS